MKNLIKQNWKKATLYFIGATLTAIGILFGLSSCNVSRTIQTKAEYYQKGDTSVHITTRTEEIYNANKQQ